MNQINIILEFVPHENPRDVTTYLCSFTVPENITPDEVRDTFANAFHPSIASARNQGADTNVAIMHALKTTEKKLDCECFLMEADAGARFII